MHLPRTEPIVVALPTDNHYRPDKSPKPDPGFPPVLPGYGAGMRERFHARLAARSVSP